MTLEAIWYYHQYRCDRAAAAIHAHRQSYGDKTTRSAEPQDIVNLLLDLRVYATLMQVDFEKLVTASASDLALLEKEAAAKYGKE